LKWFFRQAGDAISNKDERNATPLMTKTEPMPVTKTGFTFQQILFK
jgi:hypothetical protein